MNILAVLLTLIAVTLTTSSPTSYGTSNRIVNGYAVHISEVPYQASLQRKSNSGWAHSCGAVLITVNSVLSAAHCVHAWLLPSELRIVVGTSYRSTGGRSYDIANIYPHENYSASTLDNDIALMVTAKKMSFCRNVKSIAFAEHESELAAGTEALVSGFGLISHDGPASQSLQAAVVKIVSQMSCARAYMRIGTITAGMVCASDDDPPRDACQGDSGGPLVAHNKLVGIVSWGEGCANVTYPGVYTRVAKYSPWIHDKLSKI